MTYWRKSSTMHLRKFFRVWYLLWISSKWELWLSVSETCQSTSGSWPSMANALQRVRAEHAERGNSECRASDVRMNLAWKRHGKPKVAQSTEGRKSGRKWGPGGEQGHIICGFVSTIRIFILSKRDVWGKRQICQYTKLLIFYVNAPLSRGRA